MNPSRQPEQPCRPLRPGPPSRARRSTCVRALPTRPAGRAALAVASTLCLLALTLLPSRLPAGPTSMPASGPRPGPALAYRSAAASRAYTEATATPFASATPAISATAATPNPTPPAGDVTPTASLTPTQAATRTLEPPASATWVLTPTATAAATASPDATASPVGATKTPAPVSPSPDRPRPIYLPYLARSASLAAPGPRVWGTQFVMEWDASRHADNVLLELPRARAAGIGSVRSDLRWMDVEPRNLAPDAFDWRVSDRHLGDYSAAGLDVLVSVIAYPRWAMEWSCGGRMLPGMEAEWRQFVRAAAERYAQAPYRVAAWEIGNEVDGTLDIDALDRARPPEWGQGEPTTPHGGCWAGRAAEYLRFVRAAREEILAVDPGARITHGGLAYVDPYDRPAEVQAGQAPDFDIHFLDDFLLSGGCDSVDFFSYHWFLDYPWQPGGAERHARLRSTLRRYGCPKPIWITETFRLSTPDEPDPQEMRQVEFLTREIFEILAQPDLERIYWYGWVDFPKGVAGQFTQAQRGLVTRERRAKLGLQVLPHTISHSNGIPEDLSDDRVALYRFSWPRSGRQHLVAWSKTGRSERVELPTPAMARAGITARIFDRASLEAGRCCTRIALVPSMGRIVLDLGSAPVFITVGE
ncbi:MAG: hypothetical protein KDH92_13405 [Chloroflexi bacterium]|nr:hypothetical protein [Chloroflexota bacterium]